jgi:hypothetical protein
VTLDGGDKQVTGCITSGGTESIILSVKAHREWGTREKGLSGPLEIIAPASAIALSPGSSSISTYCISCPWISKSTSSELIGGGDAGFGVAISGPLSSDTLATGSH